VNGRLKEVLKEFLKKFWPLIVCIVGCFLFAWPIFGLLLKVVIGFQVGGRVIALLAGPSMVIGAIIIVGVLGPWVMELIRTWLDSHKWRGSENQN